MNKLKVLTSDIINECINELYDCKAKKFLDDIAELQGQIGLIHLALEEMHYHGKLIYPKTYEYRRELTKYYIDSIKNRSKFWRAK